MIKLKIKAEMAIARTKAVQQSGFIEAQESIEDISDTEILQIESTLETTDTLGDLSRTSLPQFINYKNIVNDQDFVLFGAYYYEKKNNIKEFSSEDVKNYYIEARKQEYSNLSVLFRELIKKGYIMLSPDSPKSTPKKYILTDEGIKYVESLKSKESINVNKNNESNNIQDNNQNVLTKQSKRKTTSKESYQISKDLDLSGTDNKISFNNFYDEKSPKSCIEFNVVSIYYLSKIMNIEKITVNDIYTCYKTVNKKVPVALKQSLIDTSGPRYGYINIENNEYSLPTRGENFVEQSLPKINYK